MGTNQPLHYCLVLVVFRWGSVDEVDGGGVEISLGVVDVVDVVEVQRY
jgi:hypothetical protein